MVCHYRVYPLDPLAEAVAMICHSYIHLLGKLYVAVCCYWVYPLGPLGKAVAMICYSYMYLLSKLYVVVCRPFYNLGCI